MLIIIKTFKFMKKNGYESFLQSRNVEKILITMKLISILLFLSLVQVSATVYSQSKKFSFDIKETRIINVLEHIEEISDFRFFFQREQVDVNKIVSFNVSNESVETILDRLFKDQNVSYKVLNDGLILLSSDKLLSISSSNATQQARVIKGVVTDDQGNALVGVNVYVKGTTNGTITDINGNYTISVENKNTTLVYSFIGFSIEEVKVGENSVINVTLKEDVINLDEVVSIGYGTKKIKDVTGSVSSISSKHIEDRPVLQFEDALAGKAAGVQVISSSGKPQSAPFIRIRGTTSITGSSEPLYVVDGVPTDDMKAINVEDIESISILKDASASAIYGASGANGVVIIKTKRGENKRPTVEFKTKLGFSKVTKNMAVLHSQQYIDLMDELGLSTDWSLYTANTDWQNEVLRKAPFRSYQLSLSGSDEKTNYYIAGNQTKNDGIVRNNTADRYSAKVNFDRKVNKWLKVGTSISYSKWHDVNITDNIGAGRGGVILGMVSTPELIGIYNDDGTYTGNPLQTSWENPVASTDAPEVDYYQSRFSGNVYLEANITTDLKLKTLGSIEESNGKYTYFLDPFTTDWGRAINGTAEESSDYNKYWLSETTLSYSKRINNHSIEALAGFIVSGRESNSLYAATRNFANTAVKTINGGSVIDAVSSSYAARSNVSQMDRINYAFKDKYLVTANFRADASSVFGPGKQWGYFPSFSVGWRMSEEGFLSSAEKIDDIKLRIGWGQVGNDRIRPYAWYGTVGTGYNYVVGGNIVPGISVETIENKDLKWETTTQTDIGIDIMLFNQRLGFTVDGYIKNTSDLLLSMPVPRSTGFESTIQNVGEIQNKGIECQVNSRNLVGSFKWNTDFNISFNRNEVVFLDDQVINTGYIYQRGNVSIAKEGESMGAFYGYIAEGVDPETGMMIYKDINNDGEFTPDDKTIIGNANPKFFFGMNNTFSFMGFDLSMFIQGVQGNDVFNATRIESESMNDFKNQLATTLNRWEMPGDITNMPKATLGEKYNSELSTRFIEDGSYLRIKSLTLSYSLPRSVLSKLKLNKLMLYISGENLYTFTKYSGFDPELNAFGGDNLAQGIDFGTYPQSRSLIFGIDLSF
jgi:TonB-linked SusC/RagA family outer membrane protein